MKLVNEDCSICESDVSTLKSTIIPQGDASWPNLKIADLFSGCGGLSLGIQRAAHDLGCSLDVRLAVDSDHIAISVYRKLFPTATSFCKPLEQMLDGDIGSPHTTSEADAARRIGQIDVLLGGPPCQGHSDLNNHSRRDDPRNSLYLLMARAAEVFCPTAIIVENVPTVTHDVRKVVQQTIKRLDEIGYTIGQDVVDLSNLGVPQRRRRHVIVAVRDCSVNPQRLIERLNTPICSHVPRNVRWAIGDLVNVRKSTLFDSASRPNAVNQYRIDWLFENGANDLPNELRPPCHRSDHSYISMYGKMDWESPAQTVTTGFNYMGQGRFVHPSQRRVITPHEAARLQMLPDYIDFSCVPTRKNLAKLIGNSVPPPLSFEIGKSLIPSLKGLSTAN